MSRRKQRARRKLSAAQIQARRENAQHSTGPRSQEGKRQAVRETQPGVAAGVSPALSLVD